MGADVGIGGIVEGAPQGLLGRASGRTKANVVAWLDERGQEWKDAVTVVAMDPCAAYRAAVQHALPSARIVADHFHLVALVNKAVTEARRRVTVDATGRRGTANDPIWAKRNRLLRGYERLSAEQFTPPVCPLRHRREIRAQRAAALDAAYATNPTRFTRRPTPPKLPTIAWINEPIEEVAQSA